MCWRGLLFLKYSHSLKKQKFVALSINHVLYVVYSYSFLKKNCSFIVQPCVVRGLLNLDQIFSFVKKIKGIFKNHLSVKIGKKLMMDLTIVRKYPCETNLQAS